MKRADRFIGDRVNPNRVYHNTDLLDTALVAAQKINFQDIELIGHRHEERLASHHEERAIRYKPDTDSRTPVARLETVDRKLTNSLGQSVVDELNVGQFKYLETIPKGSSIPCEHTSTLVTSVDDQVRLDQSIHVAYGDSPSLDDSDLLGTLIIEGIEPAPAGAKEFETTFSVDSDGYLTVTTVNLDTGQPHEMTFELSEPFEYDPIAKRWRDRQGRFTVSPDVSNNAKQDAVFERDNKLKELAKRTESPEWMPLTSDGFSFNLNTSGALAILIVVYGLILVGIGGALIYMLVKTST